MTTTDTTVWTSTPVDVVATPPVSLRKSYRAEGYYDIFGRSSERQRNRWRDTRYSGSTSDSHKLQRAASVASEYDHIAFAYSSGVRDTLATVLGYSHPLVELLLPLTWDFSAEYGWHVYVSESLYGGSRTSYVGAWDQALRTRGIDLPRFYGPKF